MTISLKHLFQSAKTDGPDNTIVQPSDWNDEHVLTQATGAILGRTSAGAGATEEISPGTGITLSAGTISADVTSVAGRTGAVTLSTADISGLTAEFVQKTSSTGAAALPAGATGDRPGTPLAGYIRYNNTTGKFEGYGSAWGNIGGGAAIGDTPPANPGAGDLWWNSADGRMYVYYTDANSSQWVDLSAGGAGQYLPLTGGDVTGNVTVTGNVGIGTTSPYTSGLTVAKPSGTGGGVRVQSGSASADFIINDGLGIYLSNNSSTLPTQFWVNGAERMRIDTSGRVTMPYQPAFSVTGPYSGSINPISVASGGGFVVLWQTVRLNDGSCYSTSTGRFTAPVAGRYLFSASLTNSNGSSGPYIQIRKNGSPWANAISYGTSYNGSSVTVVMSLAENDYADVFFGAFNVTAAIDLNYSNFCGYLIG
jgi:C1q domain